LNFSTYLPRHEIDVTVDGVVFAPEAGNGKFTEEEFRNDDITATGRQNQGPPLCVCG
jgi:hypothetical protein